MARNIGFELTFDEWWAIWEPHYANRGVESGNAVMCRTGDSGPYAVGNVRIDTHSGNTREAVKIRAADGLPHWAKNVKREKPQHIGVGSDWLSSRTLAVNEYKELDECG